LIQILYFHGIKTILKYKFPLALVILLYLTHLYTKDFSSDYQKPINGDAKAYYAYLPAIFIYQDAEYNFVDAYEEKYYAKGHRKDFLNTIKNGRKVNKTFPGVAVLYLPFFLIAHFLASVFGADADGYSLVYQYLFDFGYWVYILLGAIYYLKVFRILKFKDKHIYFSLFVLIVGTNVLFYSMVDQSVTHLFNFAMINGLVYHLLKFKRVGRLKHIYFSIALLVLIGITRPTNILVLLLIPIFISDRHFYVDYFGQLFKLKSVLLVGAIILVIGSIPFLLWQWQTGNWIVYGYGDEGFDFKNPELINFLFSYTKGWFTYSPIALLILGLGLFYMFRLSVLKTFNSVVFYAISIYIFSSWWCWYYGAGMGQRVMIDHFILLGYLMIIALDRLPRLIKKVVIFIYVILIVFNVVQTYQITTGIYPMGSPTKEVYWDNFLSLTKKAKVYEKVNWKLMETLPISLGPKSSHIVKGVTQEFMGNYVLQINGWVTYSATFQTQLKQPSNTIIMRLSALGFSSIERSRIVITSVGDNSEQHVVYLNSHVKDGDVVELEYLIEFSKPTELIEAYVWNGGSSEEVVCFDVVIESYKKQ
jgi:hypothetical protein